MPGTVQCSTHGQSEQSLVCSHLAEASHGLGFNNEPETDKCSYPDAWCDNCEIIRATHCGWTDEARELTEIKRICAGCYERARIRNTKPLVTLDDLAGLRWKCGGCDEWHAGPVLDFGSSAPYYWSSKYEDGTRWPILPSGALDHTCKTFLDADYCAIDDEYFFVRGVIDLPIIGAADDFSWGVWGSLSRENFEALLRADHKHEQPETREVFSWLSTRLSEYPDTLSLKMTARIQEPGMRPIFHLERADHPLAKEFYEGITPERVKEIMFRLLPSQPE